MNSEVQDIINQYFETFSKKDLEGLNKLYADTVVLNEWNANLFIGKDEVLEANKKLFDQFRQIDIKVNASAVTNNKSVNEITVILDEMNVDVVDVITIENKKITYIMAYRGF